MFNNIVRFSLCFLFFANLVFAQDVIKDKKMLFVFEKSCEVSSEKFDNIQSSFLNYIKANFLFYFKSDELEQSNFNKDKKIEAEAILEEILKSYTADNQKKIEAEEIAKKEDEKKTTTKETEIQNLQTEDKDKKPLEVTPKQEADKIAEVKVDESMPVEQEKKAPYLNSILNKFIQNKILECTYDMADYQTFLFYDLTDCTIKKVQGDKSVVELSLKVFVVDRDSNRVQKYDVRAIGYNDDENIAWNQSIDYMNMQIQTDLNQSFNSIGSSYIIYFISDDKLVIGIGKNEKLFDGAFVSVYRKIFNKNVLERKLIAELFVEKVYKNYSFCKVLYSKEKLLLGDEVVKNFGVGIHQNIYGSILLGSANLDPVPNIKSKGTFIYDFMVGSKFTITNSMPHIKPAFGFDFLISDDSNFDFRQIFNNNFAFNFYLGVQIDWFINRFAISPYIDFGLATTENSFINKPAGWFTFKGGLKFTYRFLHWMGLSVEAGYSSWVGLVYKEPIFQKNSKDYYRYDNLNGGFISLGLTFYY